MKTTTTLPQARRIEEDEQGARQNTVISNGCYIDEEVAIIGGRKNEIDCRS